MKNQSGVSLITLVITIIVVIILAAIALGGGALDTASQATFAGFTTEMGALQDGFKQAAITIKGDEAGRKHTVTDAQIYNYLARGAGEFPTDNPYYGDETYLMTPDESGDTHWLTRAQASEIPCTPINRAYATKYLDMKVRKVETDQASNEIVSYFITPKGNVFCWPPYIYNGKSYVTNEITALNSTTSGEYAETDATKVDATPVIVFPNEENNPIYISNDPTLTADDIGTYENSKDRFQSSSTAYNAINSNGYSVLYTARAIDEGDNSSNTGGSSLGIRFHEFINNET